jgi:hypothetical protein
LKTAASAFLGLKLTIFARPIGSKAVKKVTWAILSASALLIASSLSGYAAGGSVSPGPHARVGQTAWGGHAPSGTWGGHAPSGTWAGRPPSSASGAHSSSGSWGGHPSSSGSGGHHSGDWDHHHGGHSHFFFVGSVVVGPWWPWYPWYPYYPYYGYYPYYPYYPYYYPAPAVVEQPPQEYAESGEQESDYWYYCQESQAYYPYVKSCPGGWMKVVPRTTPPQQ